MSAFNVTGWGFIIVLVLVTLVAFVASVLFLPRMDKPGPVRHLAQAVALVLVSVLTLFSTAVLLNKKENWVSSWAQLTQDAESQQASADAAGKKLPTGVQPMHTHQKATELQANPIRNPDFGSKVNPDAPGSQYVSFPLKGKRSGQSYDVTVWLPSTYLKEPDKFYPVILGFTGFPGAPEVYTQSMNYGQMIEDAVGAGKMREAIFVVPAVLPGNYDTECVDGTHAQKGGPAPKVETYVTEDLVEWIKTNLRTIDSPDAWSTQGYSAGGWCASMLTLRHPELFTSAMTQSGYFEPIYTDGQQWNPQNDPRYLLPDLAAKHPPEVQLHYFAAQDDDLSWPSLVKFRDAVAEPTSLTAESIPTGGHMPDVWTAGIKRGFAWLGSTRGFFAPTE